MATVESSQLCDLGNELEPGDAFTTTGRQLAQLKPVDGGRAAWRVLFAAFIFEALFWGFPNAFGVWQAYYSTVQSFQADAHNIPVIGTLSQICWIGAPFAAVLTKAVPNHKLHLIVFGWALCILGLLTASFAKSVTALLATQGLMYGLGFVILTYPILDILSEWWVVRKGMAFGLISAASGLTGIFMPLILDASLHRFGHQITLRASAVILALTTAPLIPLLKSRLPVADVQRQRMNWSFVRVPLFWLYAVATTFQGLGQFIPPIFVSSYAVTVGMSSLQAAALLAVMAAAQTVGQAVFGWLSDQKISVNFLASSCCLVAALATATAWGMGKSLPMLILYSTLYGFFAFGFMTMRVAMGRAVTSEQSAVLSTYSSFVFLQGIGNSLVGPITAGLIANRVDVMQYGALKYKSTVVYVAATSMVAGVVILARPAVRKLQATIAGCID